MTHIGDEGGIILRPFSPGQYQTARRGAARMAAAEAKMAGRIGINALLAICGGGERFGMIEFLFIMTAMPLGGIGLWAREAG